MAVMLFIGGELSGTCVNVDAVLGPEFTGMPKTFMHISHTDGQNAEYTLRKVSSRYGVDMFYAPTEMKTKQAFSAYESHMKSLEEK